MAHSNLIMKTIKVAGVVAAGAAAVALISSGAALSGITAGGKYLKETIQKIVNTPAQQADSTTPLPAKDTQVEAPADVAE